MADMTNTTHRKQHKKTVENKTEENPKLAAVQSRLVALYRSSNTYSDMSKYDGAAVFKKVVACGKPPEWYRTFYIRSRAGSAVNVRTDYKTRENTVDIRAMEPFEASYLWRFLPLLGESGLLWSAESTYPTLCLSLNSKKQLVVIPTEKATTDDVWTYDVPKKEWRCANGLLFEHFCDHVPGQHSKMKQWCETTFDNVTTEAVNTAIAKAGITWDKQLAAATPF